MNFRLAFARSRERGSLSRRSSSPPLAPREVPHRSFHCSAGQSRPRLRRACGIARGARAFSPDRRDGPIRPNSHEFATELPREKRERRRRGGGDGTRVGRCTRGREREKHRRSDEERKEESAVAPTSSRCNLRREAKCAAERRNRGVHRHTAAKSKRASGSELSRCPFDYPRVSGERHK